jgi:uncharacterized protein YecT (DUF1311 family)
MLRGLATLGLLSAAAASAATPSGVADFVIDHRLTRYSVALTDLNDDGRAEALIYAMDADSCGTGGCDLYVLSLTSNSYRVVTNISITRPPIRVMPTTAYGWHDVAVWVAGGGIIPGYEARLRFNGISYPSNPTVPPAVRLQHSSGRVVIGSLLPMARTHAADSTAAPCPGATTPEVNACLNARFEQSDATLNRYYQTALKQIRYSGSEAVQRFVQAERSWVAYRDSECGSVFDRYGGTIRVSVELDCRIRITRLRTYAIWRDWLTYVDSTPPSLPRPEIESVVSGR